MSEHQLEEARSVLDTGPTPEQQAAFAHSMSEQPAVLVNGFSLSTVGRMPRLVFTEGVVPQLSPYVRAAVTMHPEDLAQLVRGGQELLARMQEAGLWTPAPVAANANGAAHEEHAVN